MAKSRPSDSGNGNGSAPLSSRVDAAMLLQQVDAANVSLRPFIDNARKSLVKGSSKARLTIGRALDAVENKLHTLIPDVIRRRVVHALHSESEFTPVWDEIAELSLEAKNTVPYLATKPLQRNITIVFSQVHENVCRALQTNGNGTASAQRVERVIDYPLHDEPVLPVSTVDTDTPDEITPSPRVNVDVPAYSLAELLEADGLQSPEQQAEYINNKFLFEAARAFGEFLASIRNAPCNYGEKTSESDAAVLLKIFAELENVISTSIKGGPLSLIDIRTRLRLSLVPAAFEVHIKRLQPQVAEEFELFVLEALASLCEEIQNEEYFYLHLAEVHSESAFRTAEDIVFILQWETIEMGIHAPLTQKQEDFLRQRFPRKLREQKGMRSNTTTLKKIAADFNRTFFGGYAWRDEKFILGMLNECIKTTETSHVLPLPVAPKAVVSQAPQPEAFGIPHDTNLNSIDSPIFSLTVVDTFMNSEVDGGKVFAGETIQLSDSMEDAAKGMIVIEDARSSGEVEPQSFELQSATHVATELPVGQVQDVAPVLQIIVDEAQIVTSPMENGILDERLQESVATDAMKPSVELLIADDVSTIEQGQVEMDEVQTVPLDKTTIVAARETSDVGTTVTNFLQMPTAAETTGSTVLTFAHSLQAKLSESLQLAEDSIKAATLLLVDVEEYTDSLRANVESISGTIGNLLGEVFNENVRALLNSARIPTNELAESGRLQQVSEEVEQALSNMNSLIQLRSECDRFAERTRELLESHRAAALNAQRAFEFYRQAKRDVFSMYPIDVLEDDERQRVEAIEEFRHRLNDAKKDLEDILATHLDSIQMEIQQCSLGGTMKLDDVYKVFEVEAKKLSRALPKNTAASESLDTLELSQLQLRLMQMLAIVSGERHPRHDTWGRTPSTLIKYWKEIFEDEAPSNQEIIAALTDPKLCENMLGHQFDGRPNRGTMKPLREARKPLVCWSFDQYIMFMPTYAGYEYMETTHPPLSPDHLKKLGDYIQKIKDARKRLTKPKV